MHLNMTFAKRRLFCLGLNALKYFQMRVCYMIFTTPNYLWDAHLVEPLTNSVKLPLSSIQGMHESLHLTVLYLYDANWAPKLSVLGKNIFVLSKPSHR